MMRSYKFRLRPTAKQHVALGRCLDGHRELYNAALQERREAWQRCRTRISYGDQSAQLSEIRYLRPDMTVWSFSSQQATLRRLNRAFAAFFCRLKAEQAPGYPRFKSATRFNSVEWPKNGDGCRWRPETSQVYLRGIGQVKVSVHRQVEGAVKTVTTKREGKRWYLVLSCDEVPRRPLPETGNTVGLDMGITHFYATSAGAITDNPRWGRAAANRLASAQQTLQRAKRASKNRAARRETVAARYRKVTNQRRDFHHKAARSLVESYDALFVEDLKIQNMTRRATPVKDPDNLGRYLPNGGRAKTGLNRSIADAGWGYFVSILRAKAEEAGRVVIDLDPRHTSDGCHECGHTERDNRVKERFQCRACGHIEHADVHAARNIHRAGLALLAARRAA